ncbi:hypothetical protein N7478_004439 [Penicillium angulare]|uniref:uncharacterized protein n=1 Tax=Penicillium angulare TaxID=116970 RepID=UPI0025410173|nr:uncharacterized protein N7478_004439 [Penicillium angulare]KAJ5279067.1 hypothetical protein N7478_004439 [Penicillium angulare]
MAPLESRARPAESWQQSTIKLQQSTSDMWRRSSHMWTDSKGKCQQKTMEAWHRSSDSWTNSKNRYIQSTAERLVRSANMLSQSTDQLYKLSITAGEDKSTENKSTSDLPAAEPASTSTEPLSKSQPPPAPPPSQIPASAQPPQPTVSPESNKSTKLSKSRKSIKTSESSQSEPSVPSVPSLVSSLTTRSESDAPSKPPPIDLDIKKRKEGTPQTKALLELTSMVVSQLQQARGLRDSNSAQLGDIEHNWINTTVTDTEESVEGMSQILEPYRLVLQKRKKHNLNYSSRKRWKEHDCARARDKYPRLVLYQSRLEKVLSHLKNVDKAATKSPVNLAKDTFAELSMDSPAVKVAELPISTYEINRSELPVDGPTVKSFTELPADEEAAASLPVMFELPAEPISSSLQNKTPIAEMPASSMSIKRKPIPKIIVTQSTGDLSSDQKKNQEEGEQPSYENQEMDEMMKWEKTRTDIQKHQSESLARIVADMESNRAV